MKIFIKIDDNLNVVSYSEQLNENIEYEGIPIETNLDLEVIEIVGNYKLEKGQLVELTEEEKETNKIDILIQTKTIEELTKENQQLWDTVEYLLKQTEMIP